MNHTRQPDFLLAALLALALGPLVAVSSSAQPPRPDPAAGADGQPRIQMPGRAGGLGPVRDGATPPEATGTGRIRGRVLDDGGLPVRRASVRTFSTQARLSRMATTDAEGHYELTDLPAGAYQVIASKGAFVTQTYGQRSRSDIGRPIALADGQAVDKIDFVLARGGVVVGRVVDEFGEPMTDASVQALRFVQASGSTRLVPVGRNAQTDDLGQFRVYGLPPGEYLVSASMRGGMGGAMGGPLAESQSTDNVGYAPSYSPGTPNAAEATRVQVQSGQEVSADVQLAAMRMLRISGTVVTSSGKPAETGIVRLMPRGETVMFDRALGAPLRGGAFSFGKVQPGNYTLTVRTADSDGGPGPAPGRGRPGAADDVEFASVPVAVMGDDLVNVRVVTGRGLTVPGVVTVEGGTLPADVNMRVMIGPSGQEGMMNARPAAVEANGRFQIEGVFGEGRFSVMGLARGWMVKSVDYKGASVLDKPVEFTGDGGPIRVVLTNRIPIVTGTVTSANGLPLTDYEVLIFTTDASEWERPGRHVRAVRADQQGGFRAEALPPGDYYIAAFASLDAETRLSAETLQRARGVAQQITLGEGQTRSVSLRLSALPQ